jgi:hypothetical protein
MRTASRGHHQAEEAPEELAQALIDFSPLRLSVEFTTIA